METGQLIYMQSKSIDCFLYVGNFSVQWVKKKIIDLLIILENSRESILQKRFSALRILCFFLEEIANSF